jgi:hypothetical protein
MPGLDRLSPSVPNDPVVILLNSVFLDPVVSLGQKLIRQACPIDKGRRALIGGPSSQKLWYKIAPIA